MLVKKIEYYAIRPHFAVENSRDEKEKGTESRMAHKKHGVVFYESGYRGLYDIQLCM